LTDAINLFLEKATNTTINTIVWIIGIIVIIALGITLFLFIKKLYKTFVKEEKYISLLENYNKLENSRNSIDEAYNKVVDITNSIYQLSITTNMLLHDLVFNMKPANIISDKANELIQTTVYVIPQHFKIKVGDYHRCYIWMKSETDIHVLENYFSSTNKLIEENLSIENSFAGRIFSTREPRYSGDITHEKDFEKRPNSKGTYKSLLGVPIMIGENVLGVLTIDAKKADAFDESDDTIYLSLFASIISNCLLIMAKVSDIIPQEG